MLANSDDRERALRILDQAAEQAIADLLAGEHARSAVTPYLITRSSSCSIPGCTQSGGVDCAFTVEGVARETNRCSDHAWSFYGLPSLPV